MHKSVFYVIIIITSILTVVMLVIVSMNSSKNISRDKNDSVRTARDYYISNTNSTIVNTQLTSSRTTLNHNIVNSAHALFPDMKYIKNICGVRLCTIYLSNSPNIRDTGNEWVDSPDDTWIIDAILANGLIPIGSPKVGVLKDGNAVYMTSYQKP